MKTPSLVPRPHRNPGGIDGTRFSFRRSRESPGIRPSPPAPGRRWGRIVLPVLAVAATVFFAGRAEAAFHLWEIRQIYSNADGSVQYIKLFNPSGGEEFVQGRTIHTYRDGGQDRKSYTFPSNLDTGGESTAGRYMLLATGPIEGVEPDFVIPANFIPVEFDETGTFDMEDMAWASPFNILTYDSIPVDGFRSLDQHGDVVEPATVRNFANDTAELSPPAGPGAPEVLAVAFRNGAFEMSFFTESGHTYTVEFTDSLEVDDWEIRATFEGNGEIVDFTDDDPGVPQRFYRVIVD